MKKLFGESRGKNEEMEKDLREKLADYKSKVDDAWDLLREATDKIMRPEEEETWGEATQRRRQRWE